MDVTTVSAQPRPAARTFSMVRCGVWSLLFTPLSLAGAGFLVQEIGVQGLASSPPRGDVVRAAEAVPVMPATTIPLAPLATDAVVVAPQRLPPPALPQRPSQAQRPQQKASPIPTAVREDLLPAIPLPVLALPMRSAEPELFATPRHEGTVVQGNYVVQPMQVELPTIINGSEEPMSPVATPPKVE